MTDQTPTPAEPAATPAADPTPVVDPTPAAVDPAVDPAATPAPDADPAAAENEPAEKPEDDSLLFGEDKDPEEGEGDDDAAKEGDEDGEEGEEDSPVAFDLEKLEVPEELPIPDDIKAEVSELAEKHGLNTEQVQDMTNLHVKLMHKQSEQWADIKQGWRKEVEADPDIGGENLSGVKSQVNDMVRQFGENPEFGGSPELMDELKTDLMLLGLGNKKSFIKFMNNIAKATSGDDIAGTKSGASGTKLPREQVLYPGMK